jgi:hypothetical protein
MSLIDMLSRSCGCSAGALLLGGSVLAGWLTHHPALVTVRPGLPAMSPITASAFMLAGPTVVEERIAPGTACEFLLLGF